MNQLKTFLAGIAITFGLPWFFLIVLPSLRLAGMDAVPFGDEDEATGFYPASVVSLSGQEIYASEGCANCHTQMVRPLGAGTDVWRMGWGKEQEDFSAPSRPSRMRDYLGEPYAYLGASRNGPDLSSVGYRRTDADWHLMHLYNPRSINSWSNMPAFRHLFEVRDAAGNAGTALDLPEGFGPGDGKVVVPKPAARSLVQYLLSLKKDSPVPVDLVPLPEVDEAPAEEVPAEPAATTTTTEEEEA